eukprot:CAMPEP_0174722200 /NCGR_PEP_ID=MMETSP1094-20130205/37839_1 /TAXON_ID=156173 /ORGANISM="Chrysochromulina brevifilum, Strain UTEX LB 985" /LENGTH=217 /DNA_ID=CAMNT_0015923009 /DNA_START=154 /DNA_END=803 /DNA_ORIENTATION=-
MWEDFSDNLKDDGGGELVDYAKNNLSEAANAAQAGDEMAEEVTKLDSPLNDGTRGGARVPQRAHNRLQRSYQSVKRLLEGLEPGVAWSRHVENSTKCGVVKAACHEDGSFAWCADRWKPLYERQGALIIGMEMKKLEHMESNYAFQQAAEAAEESVLSPVRGPSAVTVCRQASSSAGRPPHPQDLNFFRRGGGSNEDTPSPFGPVRQSTARSTRSTR